MRVEFVVVGGGLTGLSAAWALSRRGREVLLLEQSRIGHLGGGSHGSCRIHRLGYEDAEFVTLARRARSVWAELEQDCGEQLLHPAPQLTFGPQMPVVRAAMHAAGAGFEVLTAAHAAELFPAVRTEGEVLLESQSAVIAADRALAVLAAAVTSGIRTGPESKVAALADDGRQVIVSTRDGDIAANRVIICAGPWTAGLLAPAGITVPGSASLEQVVYLTGPAAADHAVPIVVHYGGEFPYGLPVPGRDLYKFGLHHGGPAVDPDRQGRDEDADLSARTELAARSILPGLDPHPVAVERCVYDNSPDEDFIVDRIGNVVIGSGTSGHGFKFGPLLGQWLAFLAVKPGREAGKAGAAGASDPAGPPPARFALRRF